MAPTLPSTISQTSTSYPNTGELLGDLGDPFGLKDPVLAVLDVEEVVVIF